MHKTNLATLALLLSLAGCSSSKDKAPAKATATAATDTVAQVASDGAPLAAGKTTDTVQHPDLVRICEHAQAKLETGIGNDIYLLGWTKELALQDVKIKGGMGAIADASASQRYLLVKQIAKEAGHPDWSCPELEQLFVAAEAAAAGAR